MTTLDAHPTAHTDEAASATASRRRSHAARPVRPAHSRPFNALRGLAPLIAVAIPTGMTGLHALLYGRWIVDDAAITFAYARSITTGAGPTLQVGAAAVEGYSNPAWLAILTVGRWLGLFDRGTWFGVPDYVTFPKLVALICCCGIFAGFFAAARAVTSSPVLTTISAGVITAAVPAFVIWCFSGLENSLLALCTVWIGAILVRAVAAGRLLSTSTAVWCGTLAAVAALTRPDGLIYAAAFPAAALLLLRRETLGRAVAASAISVAAFAAPVGAYLGWRIATFGEYLPNTALAKSQGLPGPQGLARPGELLGYAGWLAALLGAIMVGAALAPQSRESRGLTVLLVPLGLALVAFGVLQPDWMGQYRFATPVWPLAALAGTLAAAQVVPRLQGRGRTAVALAACAATLVSGVTLASQARAFRANPTAPLCLVVQNTGYNVAGYARIVDTPHATVLAPDIGGAALSSRVEIVDLAGLASARIAGYWRTANWQGLRDYVFDEVRPTFIKSHDGWSTTTGLTADPRLAAAYAEIGSTAGTTDWVRRDALRETTLSALRAYHAEVAAPADRRARDAPRSSCGDVLRP